MTVGKRSRSMELGINGVLTPFTPPTPVTTAVNLGDVLLHQWIVRIPNGHNGQTGIALTLGGVIIVPFDDPTGNYVVGNDSLFTFDIGTEVGKGLATVQYNGDIYTHTHYVQFVYTPITLASIGAPQAPGFVAVA